MAHSCSETASSGTSALDRDAAEALPLAIDIEVELDEFGALAARVERRGGMWSDAQRALLERLENRTSRRRKEAYKIR